MTGPVSCAANLRHQCFDGLDIAYDARVLTPRPWTEAQARWAAHLAAGAPPGLILELCSGAGQIGLAAARRSGRRLLQVDVDPVACAFARHNAEAARLADQVEVRCQDVATLVLDAEPVPLILADPPYLDPGEAARYPDDPPLAIDGGPDGLRLVRACLAVIDRHLHQDGAALVQLRGPAQVAQVLALLPVEHPDLLAASWAACSAERALLHLRRA